MAFYQNPAARCNPIQAYAVCCCQKESKELSVGKLHLLIVFATPPFRDEPLLLPLTHHSGANLAFAEVLAARYRLDRCAKRSGDQLCV